MAKLDFFFKIVGAYRQLTRLPKFEFSPKFPIRLHVILLIQILENQEKWLGGLGEKSFQVLNNLMEFNLEIPLENHCELCGRYQS